MKVTYFMRRGSTHAVSCFIAILLTGIPGGSWSQEADLPAGPSGMEVVVPAPGSPPVTANEAQSRLNLLWLLQQGGAIMWLIAAASLMSLMLMVERALSLRTSKILPMRLMEQLSETADRGALLDPREAYRWCQDYPSAASRIIRAALLKVGRPPAEIEQAVSAACQREGERLHANVRWLNLITAVAPLLGLLGTVWGMIRAFYDMTQLTAGQNKADFLAAGIYTALVTTLGGLAVAIPTAVVAHLFEGRITSVLLRVEELVQSLLPQWERFEGKVRVSGEALANPPSNGDGQVGVSPTPVHQGT